MKRINTYLLAILLCGAWPVLQAQDAPAGDSNASDEGTAAEVAVAAAENAPAAPESDPAEDAAAAAEEDLLQDPGALVEEDPAIAASAEEEFDPDEEISEDYPVPLPSDI